MKIIVAYAYNLNGMTTWCVEAAASLHKAGYDVTLVASPEIKLVGFDFPVVLWTHSGDRIKNIFKKIANRVDKYFKLLPGISVEGDFLIELDKFLKKAGIYPTAYLLNQSNLISSKIATKQLVVAWANPPFLKSYIKRVFELNTGERNLFDEIYNALYWYKSDWNAYRKSHGVLSVTKELYNKLSKELHHIYQLYPPCVSSTNISNTERSKLHPRLVSIAFMSLYIDDPRKGYDKILTYLSRWQYRDKVILHLIGSAADEFINRVHSTGIEFVYYGRMNRKDALKTLSSCDIMLFASSLDDWGFVQVEAMALGLAVIAPNNLPSSEIISNDKYLFNLLNKQSFFEALDNVILNVESLRLASRYAITRYQSEFDGSKFASQIAAILKYD